jgi:hypothetical protein
MRFKNMKLKNNLRKKHRCLLFFIAFILITPILFYVLTVICVYMLDYIRINTFSPPNKFSNIPADAKWGGGVDGGHWMYFKKKTDSVYNIELYEDFSGTKLHDTLFVAYNDDKGKINSLVNISEHFAYYNGNIIFLKYFYDSSRYCYLKLLKK